MSNAFFKVPVAVNEPVKSYAPGSPERASLMAKYQEFKDRSPIDIPMYIGGQKVTSAHKKALTMPHDHQHVLGYYNQGDASHVAAAIDAALAAKSAWAALPWQDRAAVFLRAADLLAGPFRDRMNAATMLAQSKCISSRNRRRLRAH